jgi:hypothetical protein
MRTELEQKHEDQAALLTAIDQVWGILDDLQELVISQIFNKWKDTLSAVVNVYCAELFWFHACFSTYTLEAFPNKALLFQEIQQFLTPYRETLDLFSKGILQHLEALSQQVYAFRDRAGDFNLLYTGILSINLKKEENHFQFELYTPSKVKKVTIRLSAIQDRYIQLFHKFSANLAEEGPNEPEQQKNYRLYADEILKTANFLLEDRELLMYCGSRKLFTGPQFMEEDFAHYYQEVIDIYEHAYAQLHHQSRSFDPLDSIIELRSLRERAQFDVVYERYSEMVKYKALKKAWHLMHTDK